MTSRILILVIFSPVFVSPVFAQWTAVPPGNGSIGQISASVPAPVMDAMGDAQDALGAGPPLLDIDTLDVTFDADTLDFSLSFFGEISPPSSGAANSVVGVIDLDVDQNALTGGAPLQNDFSPPFLSLEAGIDFRIAFFGDMDQLTVLDAADEIEGTIPATYTATSVSGSVPLALLANDDGLVDFTAIIGTIPQPTDAEMDVLGFSVPEPSSLALFLVAMAFVRRCEKVSGTFLTPFPYPGMKRGS